MIAERDLQGRPKDIAAVFDIVRKLLDLDGMAVMRGTFGHLAESFVKVPITASARDLLQVSDVAEDGLICDTNVTGSIHLSVFETVLGACDRSVH
jgi:hypothetical protein